MTCQYEIANPVLHKAYLIHSYSVYFSQRFLILFIQPNIMPTLMSSYIEATSRSWEMAERLFHTFSAIMT